MNCDSLSIRSELEYHIERWALQTGSYREIFTKIGEVVAHQTSGAEVPSSNPASPTYIDDPDAPTDH